MISELSDDLIPTGKIFSSQIVDNKGSFEIKNLGLISRYVELKSDGFYFNEVKNKNSSAQLTLYALSDISDKSSINVNILSNLEKNRIDFLVSSGIDFTEAKRQAQSEILSIFEIKKDRMPESEELDITQPGDDNAILLAVSVILQGYLSVSDLSELMANISNDIKEDGVLNDQTLGTALINNAKTIDLDTIRKNLEDKYRDLGVNITIPDFEKYVNNFIEKTNFVFTNYIQYPPTGKYGINVLDKEVTDYKVKQHYSLTAVLPAGTRLKVILNGEQCIWGFPAFQENTGWEVSWVDDHSQQFKSTRTGTIDFDIVFLSDTLTNKVNVFVYENNDPEYTWTKEITVNE